MEANTGAGREGVRPDTGSIWQSADRASACIRPTLRAAMSGPCGSSKRSTGQYARFSRFSSHSIPEIAVSILVINRSCP